MRGNDPMHGGRRFGAGRKAGVPNKVNAELRKKIMEGGTSPLEFMVEKMRDESGDESVRLDMAKAAAPYLHPKAQSIEVPIDDPQGPPRTFHIEIVEPKPRDPDEEQRSPREVVTLDSLPYRQ